MVLVSNKRTWTFRLCSIYFTYNILAASSFEAGEKKDLVFVSDGKDFQKNYRVEDFFWTGSEDDPEGDNSFYNDTESRVRAVQASPLETWRTTTVFHTTTILFATVFPDSESCTGTQHDCKPQVSPVKTSSMDLSLPTFTTMVPDIMPCPTQKIPLTDTFELPKPFPDDGFEGDTNVLIESSTTKVSTSTAANGPAFLGPGVLNGTNSSVFPDISIDQKYWIMTILRNDNLSPKMELNSTENKLSSLYRKAYSRRQEKYFGGKDFIDRQDRKMSESVKAHILNMTQIGQTVEIIYSVSVAGKPIPAMSAANDMRLMTASEVIAELGRPILSKAEPYVKSVVPLGARVKGRTRDTWLFIGSVIAAVLLLVVLALFFALALSKKRTRRSTAKGMSNRKQVFEEEEGSSNLAFEGDVDPTCKRTRKNQPSQGDSKIVDESARATTKSTEEERRGSTTSSSCSGSSEASLVRLRHQQKMRERKLEEKEDKPRPKPRTRIRRIESSDCGRNYRRHGYVQSAGSAISRNTFDDIPTERYDDLDYHPCLARSLTSYLSMPSVKAFPRGTKIPEPLNKILEPTSIRHLDADSDSPVEYPHCSRVRHQEVDVEQICEVKTKRKAMTRHASLEGDDPGFIGPVVWNRHCQKITGETVNVEEVDENINVGRMRKRFNELLDDALSMFGSRNESPEASEVALAKQPDNRVHSAIVRPADLRNDNPTISRPKTTGSKRPQSSLISGPRGAWETPSCSTLARPATAEVCRKSSPTIDKNLIYVNSELPPNDPAIPLIAAIKSELQKFEDPSQ